MNRSYIIASSLAVAVFAAFAQDAATTIAASATLKDGSSVKGEFCTERVTGSTIFTEELRLDPAIVKSLEAQIEMVRAGLGMALMPSGLERFCVDDSVRFYSFAEPLPRREVVVMWRRDRKLSKVAEELKDVIHGIEW